MELKKLTGVEILKIIKENFTEREFGGGNYTYPNDFELSKEVLNLDEIRNNFFRDKIKSHPFYGKGSNKNLEKLYDTYYSMESTYSRAVKLWHNSLGLGEIIEVEQYGGEGEGSIWYSVKYFPVHDVYIRIDGSYTSYHGTDFYLGHGKEVFPVTKTIKVYE